MTRPEDDSGHGWFGEHWGAPICDETFHVPTPVGAPCLDCEEPIAEGDQGLSTPFFTDETFTVRFRHLDCFLRTILPHGPECWNCRGLERNQHKMSCSYRKHGGNCDCPFGDDMRRMLDPKTTLADVDKMAESMGISRERLLDIRRQGFSKRIRAHKRGGA